MIMANINDNSNSKEPMAPAGKILGTESEAEIRKFYWSFSNVVAQSPLGSIQVVTRDNSIVRRVLPHEKSWVASLIANWDSFPITMKGYLVNQFFDGFTLPQSAVGCLPVCVYMSDDDEFVVDLEEPMVAQAVTVNFNTSLFHLHREITRCADGMASEYVWLCADLAMTIYLHRQLTSFSSCSVLWFSFFTRVIRGSWDKACEFALTSLLEGSRWFNVPEFGAEVNVEDFEEADEEPKNIDEVFQKFDKSRREWFEEALADELPQNKQKDKKSKTKQKWYKDNGIVDHVLVLIDAVMKSATRLTCDGFMGVARTSSRLAKLWREAKSHREMISCIVTFIQLWSDRAYFFVTGEHTAWYDGFVADEIPCWIESCSTYIMQGGVTSNLKDQKFVDQSDELLRAGIDYRPRVLTYDKTHPTLVRQFESMFRMLSEEKELILSLSATHKPRPAPFVLAVYGASGTGKSLLTDMVIASMATRHGVPLDGREVYVRMSGEKNAYWDNYKGSFGVLYDDIFQNHDPTSCAVEALEIIRIANNVAYPLTMAECSAKGRTMFSSDLIVLTSNSFKIGATGLSHPEAFYRRRDQVWKVDIKKEFRKPHSLALDPSKTGGRCNLTVWDFTLVDSLTEAVIDGPMGYEAFLDSIETSMRQKVASQRSLREEMMEILGITIDPITKRSTWKPTTHEPMVMQAISRVEPDFVSITPPSQLNANFKRMLRPLRLLAHVAATSIARSIVGLFAVAWFWPSVMWVQSKFNGKSLSSKTKREWAASLLPITGIALPAIAYLIYDKFYRSDDPWSQSEVPTRDRQLWERHDRWKGLQRGEEKAKGTSMRARRLARKTRSAQRGGAIATYCVMPMKPIAENMITDPGLNELLRGKLSKNSFFITLNPDEGDVRGLHGIGVSGRVALVPAHLFYNFEDQGTSTFDLLRNRGGLIPGIPVNECEVVILESVDLAFIKFPDPVQSFLSITKFFLKDGMCDEIALSDMVLFIGKSSLDDMERQIVPSEGHFAVDVHYAAGPTDMFLVPAGVKYRAPTKVGDCGSVLLAYNKGRAEKIVGIHVAGALRSAWAASALVTQEIVVSALAFLGETREVVVNPLIDMEGETPHMDLAAQMITRIGALSPKLVPWRSTDTSLRRSDFFETFQEATRAPAVLGGQPDPLILAVSKLNSPGVYVAMSRLEEVVAYVTNTWTNIRGDYPKNVLTVDEAINGCEPFMVLKPLRMDTSPGWPYVLSRDSNGPPGKQQFFDRTADERWVCGPVVQEAYDKRLGGLSRGRVEYPVWTATLKDEPVALAKIAARKTRVFVFPPVDFAILVRQYFGAWVSFIESNYDNQPIKVGIDPLGMDWHNFAKYLKMGTNHARYIASDFSTFDGTMVASIMYAGLSAINKWYDGPAYDNRIREGLFDCMVHAMISVDGELIWCNHGNPSGNPITSLINSLYTQMFMLLAFLSEAPNQGHSLADFTVGVHDGYYGDDNVIAVLNPKLSWFNQTYLRTFAQSIGMKMTNPGQDPDAEWCENPVFLGRSFWFHPQLQRWVGQLNKDSLYEMFNYYDRRTIQREAVLATSYTFVIELANYGKEVFENMCARLRARAHQEGYVIPSHLTYQEEIRRRLNNVVYQGMVCQMWRGAVSRAKAAINPAQSLHVGEHTWGGRRNDAEASMYSWQVPPRSKASLMMQERPQAVDSFHEKQAQKAAGAEETAAEPPASVKDKIKTGASKALSDGLGLAVAQVPSAISSGLLYSALSSASNSGYLPANLSSLVPASTGSDASGAILSQPLGAQDVAPIGNRPPGEGGYGETTPGVVSGGEVSVVNDSTTAVLTASGLPTPITHIQTIPSSIQTISSRLRLIATSSWLASQGETNTIGDVLSPMETLLAMPQIACITQYYTYIRAHIKVQVRINATRFHYGQAVLWWTPCTDSSHGSVTATQHTPDMFWFKHVFVSPTGNNVYEFSIPWCYPTPWFSIDPTKNPFPFGTLRLTVLSPLRSSTEGATQAVPVMVLAGFEGIEVAGPRMIAQGGVFSAMTSVAGTVAKGAGGQIAGAIVGGAMSFGMDAAMRAAMTGGGEEFPNANHAALNMVSGITTMSGINNGPVLSLTGTFSQPKAIGGDDSDLDHIPSLAARLGWLAKVVWDNSMGAGALLKTVYGTPTAMVAPIGSTEYRLTPLAFWTVPFSRWRGDLRFVFRVVASSFHTGKFMAVWTPYGTDLPANVTSFQTMDPLASAYSAVFDIAETSEFEFKCPQLSLVRWMKMLSPAKTTTYNYMSQYNTSGTLSLWVLSPLLSQTELVPPAEIHIFVGAGDGFQVAGPSYSRLSVFTTTAPNLDELVPQAEIGTQGMITSDTAVETDPLDQDFDCFEPVDSLSSLLSLPSPLLKCQMYNIYDPDAAPPHTCALDVVINLNYKTSFIPNLVPNRDGGTFPIVPVEAVSVTAARGYVEWAKMAFRFWRGGRRFAITNSGGLSSVGTIACSIAPAAATSTDASRTGVSWTWNNSGVGNTLEGYGAGWSDPVNGLVAFGVPFMGSPDFVTNYRQGSTSLPDLPGDLLPWNLTVRFAGSSQPVSVVPTNFFSVATWTILNAVSPDTTWAVLMAPSGTVGWTLPSP
uniref:Genome polyprotein n=1 Tax=Pericapritermes dicistro-like virus 1 TaxID=3032223 RepID=A0AAT9J9S9_9VIRU